MFSLSVTLAFSFCHPCVREDPGLFSQKDKEKDPGSSIKDVKDDRGGRSALFSLSVTLVFSFCHPCVREDPGLVLFPQKDNDKDSGSSIKDVEDDRGGEVSLSLFSLLFLFVILAYARIQGLFFFPHSKRQRPWIPDRGRG